MFGTATISTRMAVRLFLLVLGSVIVAIAALADAGPRPITILFSSSMPPYTVDDLRARADGIYLIQLEGSPSIHWNSAGNKPWALESLGSRANIYRDQPYAVVATIAGQPRDSITLRGVGGELDGYKLIYEDEPTVRDGEVYLAFVYDVDTPTKEGVERASALVMLRHGLFRQTEDGRWVNAAGKEIGSDTSLLR